jgi:hypothetical protein
LPIFYQLIDTTHQFYTIHCDAWCYEWAGTNFIKAEQKNNKKIKCYTMTNSGTHCSLIMEISTFFCIPRIELVSITSPGINIFKCKSGYLKIDKELWKQDIMKAEFSFDFHNTVEPNHRIFWKGKIYTAIEKL